MNDSLDLFELEVRQLPGVIGVGLSNGTEGLLVQLCLDGGADPSQVRPRVETLARAHDEQASVVIVGEDAVGPGGPGGSAGSGGSGARRVERVQLLAVIRVPTTDELEVHVAWGGRRTIGRHQGAGTVPGSVEATLGALRALGLPVRFRQLWSEELGQGGRTVTVAVGLVDNQGEPRHGIAAAPSGEEAAARATLHALNRTLAAESH